MIGHFKAPSFNPRVIQTKTAAYTVLMSDDEVKMNGEYTATLPAISTMAANSVGGKCVKIKNIGSSTVTISCNSADTIEDGSSAGATSIYLYNGNDYVILEADLPAKQWKVKYPSPAFDASKYVKDDSISGIKMNDGAHYHAISVNTNGTTAVNIFSSAGAPCALTITGVIAVAKDTVASNISITNGTSTVCSFAKSATAGAVTGEDGALTYYAVTATDTLTVVSSGTGEARVTMTYKATA